MTLDAGAVWQWLDDVKDPEVPVLSVVELGIVRDVRIEGGVVDVTITPTYSGCPAMYEIEQEITRALAARGVDRVRLTTVYAPAWTTDWLSAAARRKLAEYGIAPPGRLSPAHNVVTIQSRRGAGVEGAPVECPYCASFDTELRSLYGSTACKALRFCRACRQPFEEFKPF